MDCLRLQDKLLQSKISEEKYWQILIPKARNEHGEEFSVDTWEIIHRENGVMEENFIGKKNIVEEKTLVYLGHVLSKTGGNLENILDKRNKSIGTQKQIKI